VEHRWGERVSLNLPVDLRLAGGGRIDDCCLHRDFGFDIEWTELSPPGLARLIKRNGPWRADAVGSPLPYE
jgi:hypothetical protein